MKQIQTKIGFKFFIKKKLTKFYKELDNNEIEILDKMLES